jgi:plastocyanin
VEAHLHRAVRQKEAVMQSWNSRRLLLAAVIGAVPLTLVGPALGAGGKGPARAKVEIIGAESIKPNAYLQISFRFAPGTIPIRSGGTITMKNNTRDGHSLSIVKASQVPHTIKQEENCQACIAIAKSHGLNFEGPPTIGPPPIRLVDVGAPGFDAPGDSAVIGPKGRGGPVTFKVTARPGTILNFICIFHPWMQGRFLVK